MHNNNLILLALSIERYPGGSTTLTRAPNNNNSNTTIAPLGLHTHAAHAQ